MDAIKKKMQAMKLEKDNAMDRADACEQQAKDANLRAERVIMIQIYIYITYIIQSITGSPRISVCIIVFINKAISSMRIALCEDFL